MTAEQLNITRDLLSFLQKCPTAYQAVGEISAMLESAGFSLLREGERWSLAPGGAFYLTRNSSSLVAFRIPTAPAVGFQIAASHSDSTTFKLKPSYEADGAGIYVRLNTERYGGMLMSTWFDRPLSIAGRVILRNHGRFIAKPVMVDRDLCVIPSVAIHMNRSANDGVKLNPACDTFPLLCSSAGRGSLLPVVAEAADVSPDEIVASDLFLYDRAPGSIWGPLEEYFSAPRIDDLMCAYGTLRGFLSAESGRSIQVFALFDNEETGNATKQGAASMLLRDTLSRIAESLEIDLRQMFAASFLLSADNGHARHPNHPEFSDPQNNPKMNGGVVLKSNAAQKYATDGIAEAIFREICRRADVPVQLYSNRSDLPGGGTLGSIADLDVPVCTADIGLAQLAMHSCRETAGCADTSYLVSAARAFFEAGLFPGRDGEFELL